jgi:hypothetical protein
MNKISKIMAALLMGMFVLCTNYPQSFAQNSDANIPEDSPFDVDVNDPLYQNLFLSFENNRKLRDVTVDPEQIGTVVFTIWQLALLEEAKNQFNVLSNLPPMPGATMNEEGEIERPKGPREVNLGGILFSTSSDWIIWLNNMRVTPTALPEQIIDLKVSKTYIEMLWYDSYNDLIYPVKLRPHQRFNLDARIFVTGITPL